MKCWLWQGKAPWLYAFFCPFFAIRNFVRDANAVTHGHFDFVSGLLDWGVMWPYKVLRLSINHMDPLNGFAWNDFAAQNGVTACLPTHATRDLSKLEVDADKTILSGVEFVGLTHCFR